VEARELLLEVYKRSIEAKSIVQKYAHRTPTVRSETFSRRCLCEVFLKLENLQKTGAFKVRGALYKVYKLHREGVKGVVAASAGNHAQGVAYSARVFGMRAVIVMPETASIAKVEATKGYGAEVVLYGTVYDDAERKAREIAEKEGLYLVHPFNDLDIMAGQATIAWELLEQLPSFDAVVVPIGGGGLASGILSVLKSVRPSIKVIGVEPASAPKMKASIEAGKPVTISPRPSLADGLVTKRPGDLTYKIVSNYIDDIVVVDENELAEAIILLLERCKLLAEGAGAASIAALLSGKVSGVEGKRVVCLITGGNIDVTALYRVIVQGMVRQGRVGVLRGVVPDVPGSLKKVLDVVAAYRGNVLDIRHNRYDTSIDPWHAAVEILVEVPSRDALDKMVEKLKSLGLDFSVEV